MAKEGSGNGFNTMHLVAANSWRRETVGHQWAFFMISLSRLRRTLEVGCRPYQ